MNEKFIELCRKLKRLSEQGVGGEATTAEQKLKTIMAKHGITMDDLDVMALNFKEFDIPRYKHVLFFHVCIMVIGKQVFMGRGNRGHRSNINKFVVELSDLEFVEINARYSYYESVLDDDIEAFIHSFILNNEIYPPDAAWGQNKNAPTTEKELRRTMRVRELMMVAKEADYRKQLR